MFKQQGTNKHFISDRTNKRFITDRTNNNYFAGSGIGEYPNSDELR
jgi:hypothetical protein